MTDERIKEDDFINVKGLKFKSPFEMMKWITKAQVEIKGLKSQIEKMKCCGNCKYRIKKNLEGKIWVELCEKSYIKNICKDWELAE